MKPLCHQENKNHDNFTARSKKSHDLTNSTSQRLPTTAKKRGKIGISQRRIQFLNKLSHTKKQTAGEQRKDLYSKL